MASRVIEMNIRLVDIAEFEQVATQGTTIDSTRRIGRKIQVVQMGLDKQRFLAQLILLALLIVGTYITCGRAEHIDKRCHQHRYHDIDDTGAQFHVAETTMTYHAAYTQQDKQDEQRHQKSPVEPHQYTWAFIPSGSFCIGVHQLTIRETIGQRHTQLFRLLGGLVTNQREEV